MVDEDSRLGAVPLLAWVPTALEPGQSFCPLVQAVATRQRLCSSGRQHGILEGGSREKFSNSSLFQEFLSLTQQVSKSPNSSPNHKRTAQRARKAREWRQWESQGGRQKEAMQCSQVSNQHAQLPSKACRGPSALCPSHPTSTLPLSSPTSQLLPRTWRLSGRNSV